MLGNLDELATYKGRVEDVYEIGQELGNGAFSVVRRGRHRQTGEHVALKIIPASNFKGNVRAQAAIRSEVEAMRRIRDEIQNPVLIRMQGIFSEPTKVSIVLEELSGGELFDRIVSRGCYTERDASDLIRTLVTALGECHEKGILHRDVKPENIMYTTREEAAGIKLTDFGLALLYPGPCTSVQDNNLVGTPGYVAPEVLSRRVYGPPCDVWACGTLTYILLAGYPPFFATASETLFEVIMKGKYCFYPDAWDQISAEAKDLVFKMLTVEPGKRATVNEILNHPWIAQSCQDLEYTHLSDTIDRLKTFNARRKWRAVAAVVMLGARLGQLKKRNKSTSQKDEGEHGFSVLELEILQKAFLSSADGGVLSRAQLASVFADVGFGPIPSDRMFDLFDKDGDGTVDYPEFVEGMSSFKNSGDKALRFCFDIYDKDGAGRINLSQLKSVLSCVMRPHDVSDMMPGYDVDGKGDIGSQHDELTSLFHRLDLDGNGTIDFDEFKAGAQREPLLVQAFLAPVQQGSLATTPAAAAVRNSCTADAGSYPRAAVQKPAEWPEARAAEAPGERQRLAAPAVQPQARLVESCSGFLTDTASATTETYDTPEAAEGAERAESWSHQAAASNDGVVGGGSSDGYMGLSGGNEEGHSDRNAKRCRVAAPDRGGSR